MSDGLREAAERCCPPFRIATASKKINNSRSTIRTLRENDIPDFFKQKKKKKANFASGVQVVNTYADTIHSLLKLTKKLYILCSFFGIVLG